MTSYLIRSIALISLLLMIIILNAYSVSSVYRSITIIDEKNLLKDQEGIIKSPSKGDSNLVTDNFHVPQDTVPIQMEEGGFYRRGSIEFQLNDTYDFLIFDFEINVSSPVEIILSSGTGQTVDEEEFEVVFDISDPDYNFITFQSTFENDLPMKIEFPAGFSGNYFVTVAFFDLIDYVIDAGQSINLNLTINHFQPGVLREGRSSKLFQSDAFDQILNIFNYFNANGYVEPFSNVTLDRGNPSTGFDPSDPEYYKGVGLSIYGIVRAGNMLSSAGNPLPAEKSNILWQYLNLAIDLFNDVNVSSNIAEESGNAFYVNPISPTVSSLNDNAYMLLGIGEIIFEGARDPLVPDINILNDLLDRAITLANSIINRYENSTVSGLYHDELSDILGTPTIGNLVYLESMAILAEVFSELSVAAGLGQLTPTNILSDTFTESEQIRIQIGKKLLLTGNNKTRVNLINSTIGSGIGVEYYDSLTGILSNTSTLSGNLAYALHEASRFEFENASLITQNILRFFKASDSDLLLSKTMVIEDGTILPKIIDTLDNSLFILLAQRLENKWKDANNPDTARTWGIKAITHIGSLFDLMFDDLNNAFFAQYDNQANVIVANDNNLRANQFIANAFLQTILVKIFPVQMGTITPDEVTIDEVSNIELELSQIFLSDALNWWDFIVTFSFQIKVIIDKFGYEETLLVDLADFFDPEASQGNSKFISFAYEPTVKGNYTIEILLELEGHTLLSEEIELIALGEAIPDPSREKFEITDDSYTTSISIVDQSGKSLSSLQVEGSLGLPFDESQQLYGQKYIRAGRTDASGRIEITFDTKAIVEDNLLNTTEFYNQSDAPPFASILLYLNITNAGSFNLRSRVYILEVQVELKRTNLRISPSNLEITQGTTESFSFTVTALDQDQEPISNAIINYRVLEVPGIQNTIFTDADGEGTITLRDSDLFELSKLAIIFNQGSDDLVTTNATIEIRFQAKLYPIKIIKRVITIIPNTLIITANPVQVNIKEKNILETQVPPVEIEVATSDLFSRVVNSFARISWAEDNTNNFVDLRSTASHITPHTFSVDPSNLPAGKYTLIIQAEKDGITTTESIVAIRDGLSTSQNEVISVPVTTQRTIIIESATIQDIAITAISLLAAFFIARSSGIIITSVLRIIRIYRACPNCRENIPANIAVCSHCGRDTNFKSKLTQVENSGNSLNDDDLTK